MKGRLELWGLLIDELIFACLIAATLHIQNDQAQQWSGHGPLTFDLLEEQLRKYGSEQLKMEKIYIEFLCSKPRREFRDPFQGHSSIYRLPVRGKVRSKRPPASSACRTCSQGFGPKRCSWSRSMWCLRESKIILDEFTGRRSFL